jgi:CRP-like cAMP-binding protein
MTSLDTLSKKNFQFFRNLPDQDLRQLLKYCRRHKAAAGSVLWREGDNDNRLGFILSGRIGIKKMTAFTDKHVIVGTYGPGSVFGELCLLTNEPRSVGAEVLEDVDLLFLSNEEFENLIVCHPYLGLKLLRSLFRMTSKRLNSSYSRIASLF